MTDLQMFTGMLKKFGVPFDIRYDEAIGQTHVYIGHQQVRESTSFTFDMDKNDKFVEHYVPLIDSCLTRRM